MDNGITAYLLSAARSVSTAVILRRLQEVECVVQLVPTECAWLMQHGSCSKWHWKQFVVVW